MSSQITERISRSAGLVTKPTSLVTPLSQSVFEPHCTPGASGTYRAILEPRTMPSGRC